MDPSKTDIVIGPPGTGKTTRMIREVESALEGGVRPDKIGFISFTKKGADEGKVRACDKFNMSQNDLPHFRTLHSMAFRYLGMRRDQVFGWPHIKEIGQKLGLEFKGRSQVEDGETYGMATADRMLFFEGLAKNTEKPLHQIWNDAGEDDIDWPELERFAATMTMYKKSRGLLDFNDMLVNFVKADSNNLPKFDLLIIDEAQDLSALQWRAVELLTVNAGRVIIAGDDLQCHPAGTKILTLDGQKTIEDLDPDKDKLIYWRRDTHAFHGKVAPFGTFQVAKRPFVGILHAVSCNDNVLESTPEHLMIARIVDHSKEWLCVYIMRRGNDYRVGRCQMFNKQNASHFGVRMNSEEADGIWILKLSKSVEEIAVYEQIVSHKYNLPQICFKPPVTNTRDYNGDQQKISDAVFSAINTKIGAEKVLSDHDLLIDRPFFTPERAREKAGGTSIFSLEVCNLLPEIMHLPVQGKMRYGRYDYCSWEPFTMTKRLFEGDVYSLNVDRFHTYVAEGITVHNCIYKWSGADVDTFIGLRGSVDVLDQSYRIPSSIQTLAKGLEARVSNKRDRGWKSREEVGAVNWLNTFEDADLSKGSWLLLARNGYMLEAMEDWCMSQGFSYHSVNRDPLKSPALMAVKTWENLRRGKEETSSSVQEMFKYMGERFINQPLVKGVRNTDKSKTFKLADLKALGLGTEAIWHEALTRISPRERDFFIAARRRGEPLLKEPRIKISTIHAAKGGEADHVMLLTDMSYRCYSNMEKDMDDETRVWYVAATRSRETLNLVMPQTDLNFSL